MKNPGANEFQVVALVASAGGHAAVTATLRGLNPSFRVPIIVMQHLGPDSTGTVEMYRKQVSFPVEQLQPESCLKAGTVLVVPPRMFVELRPDGSCMLENSERGAVEKPLCRFLQSIARSFGPHAIAVVLTGMGNDGASGARELHEAGGRVLVQSPKTSEYADMPRAAIASGAADLVVPLKDMGQLISDIVAGVPNPKLRSEADAMDDLFRGPGLARAQVREVDWSATSLGPVHLWQLSLKAIVRHVLASHQPMVLRYGPDYTKICNDAYLALLGAGVEPQGKPSHLFWGDQWEAISTELKKVELSGDGTVLNDQYWVLRRGSAFAEAYFTVAYIEPGSEAAPRVVDLRAEGSLWPLVRAMSGEPYVLVNGLADRVPGLIAGPWQDPLHSATAIPLNPISGEPAVGVLILGHSQRLAMDAAYAHFLEQIAVCINSILAEAKARQRERDHLERLSELDRLKTDFFANVSHEFRTPLTLLLAPLDELLRQQDQLPATMVKEIDVAARNSRRLLGLVNDLLDFTQIESRRQRALLTSADICTMTSDIASAFRSAIEAAGLKLRVECDSRMPPVQLNREMWEKVVSNLLSNALKFTFHGRISVILRALKLHAELEVADTGVGIPANELPNVFKRFHRVQGARARTAEGSGIGLSIVDDLVKRMGGQLRVRSTEGRGTTFTIWMPYKSRRLTSASSAENDTPSFLKGDDEAEQSANGGTRRVASALADQASRWRVATDDFRDGPEGVAADLLGLPVSTAVSPAADGPKRTRIVLADDNADLRDYLCRLFAPRWDVEAVPDGQAAIEAIRREPPDLVLADVMMPRLSGFDLLKLIRDDPTLRYTPVVLVTARAGEEAAIEGLLAGADDYIAKPFSPRELVARVRAIVDRAHSDTMLRQNQAWLAGQKQSLQIALRGAPLEESLEVLVNSSIEHYGSTTRAAFYLAARDDKTLYHVVGMGPDYAKKCEGFPIGPDSFACGLAIHHGKPILTTDVRHEPLWERWLWITENFGFRACGCFPLHSSEGKALGIFAIYWPEPHEATPADIAFANTLADIASIIVARHFEAEERRRAETSLAIEADAMTRLRELADRLMSTSDLHTAMSEVMDTAITLHEADRGTVQVYDPVTDTLWYATTRGFDTTMLDAIPPVDRDFHSTCAAALRSGEPVIVPDIPADVNFADHCDTAAVLDYRAAFSFPMTTRQGDLQGVLTVHFRDRREPTERELRWAALYAQLGAHHIERGRTEGILGSRSGVSTSIVHDAEQKNGAEERASKAAADPLMS